MWSDIGDIIGTDASCNFDTDNNDADGLDCGEIIPFISCAELDPTGGCPGNTEGSSGATEHNGTSLYGVWARSAFDLSPFGGRKSRLRWIGTMGGGWSFGTSRSFLEPESGSPYQDQERDDGWWIDDIKLTQPRPLSLAPPNSHPDRP